MFQNLIGLAWGIGSFALVIGVTVIVLQNFAGSIAGCNTGFEYNATNQLCQNATNVSITAAVSSGTGTVNYLGTQMGTSGLAGWAPAIIALSVGLLFLGAFFVKGGPGGAK